MKRISWLLGLAVLAAGSLRADARADFLAAAAAQKANQWAEAAQGYSKVTVQLPNYAPAWKQLATARFYMKDLEGAVASADRYLDLKPDDQAFWRWSDSLRRRLKMPPRPTPGPTPGVPTPTPEAQPDSLLVGAPPPGADAEIVPVEEAAAINSQAAAKIGELEQVNTRTFAEEMADESASILRKREPSRGNLRLGLRLLGGLGLGLGSFKHGEDVNSSTGPSGNAYDGKPAGGFSGAAELLVLVSDRLDIGLGVFPLVWNDKRDSKATDTYTRSDSSEAGAAFLPVMAGLTWHQPLLKGFNGVLSVGLGAIPSARVHVKEQLAQTAAAGLNVRTSEGDLDYGLAPAWRVMAGGEWAAGKKLGFILGVQAFGASFADGTGSADYEITDETGAVLLKGRGVAIPATALSVLNVNLLAGLNLRF